jgi:hypothetical protein
MNSFKLLLFCWLFGCETDIAMITHKEFKESIIRCFRCDRFMKTKKFRLYKEIYELEKINIIEKMWKNN